MAYQLFDEDEREWTLAPATAERVETVHRLQVRSRIVQKGTKEDICERRGWEVKGRLVV